MKRLWGISIAGALLATVGDTFHVAFGIDAYPASALNLLPHGVPIWVPLEFGLATVLMWAGRELLRRGAPASNSWSPTLMATLAFFSVYLASALIPSSLGPAKTAGLYAVSLLCVLFLCRSAWQIAFVALTALAGTAVELGLVTYGVFSYLQPETQLGGVPLWLPALYLPAATAIVRCPSPAVVPARTTTG